MCLKIGENLDIQISYKILRLELSSILSFLGFSSCFQGRLFFLAVLMKNEAGPLGDNLRIISWSTIGPHTARCFIPQPGITISRNHRMILKIRYLSKRVRRSHSNISHMYLPFGIVFGH